MVEFHGWGWESHCAVQETTVQPSPRESFTTVLSLCSVALSHNYWALITATAEPPRTLALTLCTKENAAMRSAHHKSSPICHLQARSLAMKTQHSQSDFLKLHGIQRTRKNLNPHAKINRCQCWWQEVISDTLKQNYKCSCKQLWTLLTWMEKKISRGDTRTERSGSPWRREPGLVFSTEEKHFWPKPFCNLKAWLQCVPLNECVSN